MSLSLLDCGAIIVIILFHRRLSSSVPHRVLYQRRCSHDIGASFGSAGDARTTSRHRSSSFPNLSFATAMVSPSCKAEITAAAAAFFLKQVPHEISLRVESETKVSSTSLHATCRRRSQAPAGSFNTVGSLSIRVLMPVKMIHVQRETCVSAVSCVVYG